MADKSKIEWTDATWNVVLGCDRVSAGCDNCYAITNARIRESHPNPKVAVPYQGLVEERDGRLDWTGQVRFVEDRLTVPLRWRKPRRVFVNAQSDLFHKDVSDEQIARVWAVMALAQRHTFQILTKRPARMRALLSNDTFRAEVKHLVLHCDREGGLTPGRCLCGHPVSRHNELAYCQNDSCLCGWEWRHPEVTPVYGQWPLRNVHLGVSVEDQKAADLRIHQLLATPAAVRFLSCEPLLGPVDLELPLSKHILGLRLDDCLACTQPYDFHDSGGFNIGLECPAPTRGVRPIDWVIAGGESGPGARPMHPDWARSLRDQCAAGGVAFLFKQWGEWAPRSNGVKNGRISNTRWQYESRRFTPDGVGYTGDAVDNPVSGYLAPGMESMLRVGKKAAGRLLDGRTHDDYPTTEVPA